MGVGELLFIYVDVYVGWGYVVVIVEVVFDGGVGVVCVLGGYVGSGIFRWFVVLGWWCWCLKVFSLFLGCCVLVWSSGVLGWSEV